jgi:hypothetical protein
MFRGGKPAIGLAIAMREGGDIFPRAQRAKDRTRSRPTCRSASRLRSGQSVVRVRVAIREFTTSPGRQLPSSWR